MSWLSLDKGDSAGEGGREHRADERNRRADPDGRPTPCQSRQSAVSACFLARTSAHTPSETRARGAGGLVGTCAQGSTVMQNEF